MPDESLDAMSFRETVNNITAVLPDTLYQVIGHSDVERAVSLVGENVDKEGRALLPWTPAFAGVSGT
jgi:hypothetical protein